MSLEPFTHNSKSCIAIKFAYDFETKECIKQFNGVYWTKTHRTFYIYYDEVRLEDLKIFLKNKGIRILDNHINNTIPRYSIGVKLELKPLNEEKIIIYRHFLEFLKGKRFSKSTIAAYTGFILEFLRFTDLKPVKELNEIDVRQYIEWSVKKLNYAISTHRQMVSSFKHFAYFYPACSIDSDKIYMPKKDKKLPVVLSIEEVFLILQSSKT